MNHSGDLFTSSEQSELQRIWEWAQTTQDGSLSDFAVEPDATVWSHVCSEAHICTTKSCGANPKCPYQRARKRLISADVVVMNHTLFFMNLGGLAEAEENEQGYLFANDFVIFDEAHTIEQVAARQIGLGVSQYGLRYALQRLYNPKTKKGLFQVLRNPDGVREVAGLLEEADAFFDKVGQRADFKKDASFACASRISSRTRSARRWRNSSNSSCRPSAPPTTKQPRPSCRISAVACATLAPASPRFLNRSPMSTCIGSSALARRRTFTA
jgi:ATP-dependent DNA helicase DinG